MNFLKTSAFLLGFAVLGIACGDSSNNTPDAPIYGGNGGAGGTHADAYVAPGTGGAGAGGATVAIDSGAGGTLGPIDANPIDSSPDIVTSTVDSGGEAGVVVPPIDIHKQIINAATTSVGLTVGGPATIPYTSCK